VEGDDLPMLHTKILIVLICVFVLSGFVFGDVSKLPKSHSKHVATVEAAKTAVHPDPDWYGRVGTIKWAISQSDGTLVTVDNVTIGAIYKSPQAYFVVYDWYTDKYTLIVNTPSSSDLRPGQDIDITGTINTMSDGRKVLEYPTILGYTDKNGKLLVRGGPSIKGITGPTSWAYKKQLVSIKKPKLLGLKLKTGVLTRSAAEIDSTPHPIKGLKTYDSIKALIDAAPIEGSWVRLRKLQIHLSSSDSNGSYLVLKDNSTTKIQVYTTSKPKYTTSRVGRLIGKIHIINGVRVIITDVGPSFDPQLGEGDVWILD
jgi:hypothetical protein